MRLKATGVLAACLAASAFGERLHPVTFAPDIARVYYTNTELLEAKEDGALPHGQTFTASNTHAALDEPVAIGVAFARQWLRERSGNAPTDFVIKNAYTSDVGVTHLYLRQLKDGMEVSTVNSTCNKADADDTL